MMRKGSIFCFVATMMAFATPSLVSAAPPATKVHSSQTLEETNVDSVSQEIEGDKPDDSPPVEGATVEATEKETIDASQPTSTTTRLAAPNVSSSVEDKNKKSKDGSHEYRRSFGIGLEAGYWFNFLERFGMYTFENNGTNGYDITGHYHLDLGVEVSFLEGTRLTLFGGVQTPLSSNPSSLAAYGGIEPAFAFRREAWELAAGLGIGFGGIIANHDKVGELSASFFLLRPFLEVRRYFADTYALYGRIGFSQWLVHSTDGITPLEVNLKNSKPITDNDNLDEGGVYLAIGFRFGSYPSHENNIGDSDSDGYKDDVDQCPNEPEDFDGFQDEDGCPDLDNDNDGIPDVDDKCPNDPEDFDGFQDEDGCPDLDNDGDGIPDAQDQCPNDPEDFDGLSDEDGCPEDDFDGDGIPDVDDKCPETPGVPQKDGCPFEKVQVKLDRIIILDKVFFNYNKDSIKRVSYPLLDDVAATIKAYPRIKKIEIGGHTDHAGSEKYNLNLSQRRANSVMKYLIQKGVEPERLVAKGYGESAPLVPLPENGKETKEGAEQNRRVEFKILEQERIVKTIREDKVKEVIDSDNSKTKRVYVEEVTTEE